MMKLDFGRETVLTDIEFPDKFVRQVTFNELSAQSYSVFDNYLRRQGIDPDTISEEDAERILATM